MGVVSTKEIPDGVVANWTKKKRKEALMTKLLTLIGRTFLNRLLEKIVSGKAALKYHEFQIKKM